MQFRCQIVKEKLIDEEAIFIDGIKIETNANKFVFDVGCWNVQCGFGRKIQSHVEFNFEDDTFTCPNCQKLISIIDIIEQTEVVLI